MKFEGLNRGEVVARANLAELKKVNSEKNDVIKSLEHLLQKSGIDFHYNKYKVSVAKRLGNGLQERLINQCAQVRAYMTEAELQLARIFQSLSKT